MNDLILHHYAGSPFSEKVRLILGFKGLAWHSVVVPVMLPKPDVVALTGGYRRTPFMQMGADIYCDTTLMCRLIDTMSPEPPLYPKAVAGVAEIVAQWADASLFWTAVPYTMQPAGVVHIFAGAPPDFMKAFGADRAAMTANMRRATTVDAGVQLQAYLERVENMLADGRRFLLGDAASIADFSVAQSIWFMRRAPPVAALLQPYPRLIDWYERVDAFGQGRSVPLSSEDAINIAAAARAHAPTHIAVDQGFAPGDEVTVTPTDYASDPVPGRLVGLVPDEVVIARDDERAGTLHVHFPRIGFQVKAVKANTP